MPLTRGTRLGGYEVAALLGAGGMGEVYRARDLRLGREVAIKVLPAGVATDPERLQRFAQEARATAALNHPHILSVFDVGTQDGVEYVVSELLDGETLRAALDRGPLPPRKVIEYGAQIARGLAAAHERHIVHRDLKPENIFLTREGRAKILDFGLARIATPQDDGAQATTSPRSPGTSPGAVLGTMGYTSPEQVRGLPVDHRSDIFSFGAVLYEMIAGRRAFRGATPADTMSAILHADPPEFESSARAIPPILDRLVRRCLEKSPEERFQSARDLAFNLEALSTISPDEPSGTVSVAPAPARRGRRDAAAMTAALVAGLLAGAAATWWLASWRSGPPAETRYQQVTFRRGSIQSARFAPDGQTVVYSAAWEGGGTQLYSARVGSVGEQALKVDGEVQDISPAGEVALLTDVRPIISFVRLGTLARMPLAGGAPRQILRDVGSASWSPDGQQLAVTRAMPDRRWRLEFPIGTVLYETPHWIEAPRVSPDGSLVAFLEHPAVGGDDRGHVSIVTRQGEKTVVSAEHNSIVALAWHPVTGEIWFSASESGVSSQLYAVRPGAAARRVVALPASIVLEDVRPDGTVLLQTQSHKGRLLVKSPEDAEERDIGWFDYPLLRDMSADGKYILFDEEGEGGGPGYSVFMRPTDGGPAVRLGDGYAGDFSPDTLRVFTMRPGAVGLRIVPIGPGDTRELGPASIEEPERPRWWPDGTRLVFTGHEPSRPRRTFVRDLASGEVTPLTPEGVVGVLVSPNGATLAAVIDGQPRLHRLDGSGDTPIKGLLRDDVIIRWSGDGRALFVSRPLSGRSRDLARLDLGTGRREILARFGPSDGAGVAVVALPVVSADGRTYAYRYQQVLSDLFVATGLR